MAEFVQLGLQQRVVAGIIHQPDVVFKFGIEANREDVPGEGNGVGFKQVSSRERAGPANRFDEPGPEDYPRILAFAAARDASRVGSEPLADAKDQFKA